MPQWWYDLSYDPLVAAVVSALLVGAITLAGTYIWTHRGAAHCTRCCPHRRR